MSRLVDPIFDNVAPASFNLDDEVTFLHNGVTLQGQVARVYASRENYHVEVDGVRYAVNRDEDRMQAVKRA